MSLFYTSVYISFKRPTYNRLSSLNVFDIVQILVDRIVQLHIHIMKPLADNGADLCHFCQWLLRLLVA